MLTNSAFDATGTAPTIRALRKLIDDGDEAEQLRLKELILADQALLDIVAEYEGPNAPEHDPDAEQLCFGNDYAPAFRYTIDASGQRVPNPTYDPLEDICGRQCPYGLYKATLESDETQGDQSCYLLLLFTQLFGVPLAPAELGDQEANRYRRELSEAIPGILTRASQSLQPETMTYSYTKQPGDIVHAGYVYDGATQQPRTHPDGTFVLEAHVVEGPQAPPALPPQTAPPAAATPVAPATPTPPMPTPPTGATPAAPTPTPPMPSMPPTPAAPEPSAPVPPAPAVASDTPAPTPPPSTEALPDIPDDTLNSDDVAAVIDSAEATMTDFITQSFRVLREQLGIGESASVAGGRVTTKPQATSGDESSESDDSSDDETAIDKYNYYLEFEFNVEGDDGTVAPMTKDEFKELILEGADESSLEAICDHLGIDYSGYKSNRARSMKSSIIRVLYKGGDVPVIPESE